MVTISNIKTKYFMRVTLHREEHRVIIYLDGAVYNYITIFKFVNSNVAVELHI